MFWKHLALTDLITGIDPNADTRTPAWGVTHMDSNFLGGFLIGYSTRTADIGRGHLMILRTRPTNGLYVGKGNYPIAPAHAMVMDRKIDDGVSDSGWVQSDPTGPGGDECDGAPNNGGYQTTTEHNCVMFFQIDF